MSITDETLKLLFDAARAQNEYVGKRSDYDQRRASEAGNGHQPTVAKGDRPGDRFNARERWDDWLTKWGWKHMGGRYWKRPGKDAPGISATVGHCKGEAGNPLLYVFSSNAPPFEAETVYSLFSAYALVEHRSDYRAAAVKLAESGFGERAAMFEFTYGKRLPVEKRDEPPETPTPADDTGGSVDLDATAADLIFHNATIRWVWCNWIPLGVLTILASEPGIGKTRLCADLARRLYHGLPWPDSSLATCPPGSKVLWVAADNQHPELGTLPGQFGFPPEILYLNAPKSNPFGGTMLDALEDLKEFEERIKRVKPALVFIDTSLNATDRSSHKPEDAKAFFVPLQRIAQRQQAAIVCVTHTNAAGKPLGRRITGQGRVVIQLSKPDPEGQPNRRKLWVTKSNSLFPTPLGITMGDAGNDYDTQPPEEVAEEAPGKGKPARLRECMSWLLGQFPEGTRGQRVSEIRTRAEEKNFSSSTLYLAKGQLKLIEEVILGKKWWRLPEDDGNKDDTSDF